MIVAGSRPVKPLTGRPLCVFLQSSELLSEHGPKFSWLRDAFLKRR